VAGDERALAAAWDRHAVAIRAVLRRSLGPGADVEDALQETFIAFFQSASAIRDPRSLRSFLIGIAIRVASRELSRRRLKRWLFLTSDGEMPEPAALDDDAAAASREAVRRLYRILDGLDVESRLAFVLRHVEGLELVDVATGLGVSLATAKRKLAKVVPVVMARVRKDPILAGYVGEDVPKAGVLIAEEVTG
jgi:RNA polymerase sigma-70 factor (ECF subfamily)